MNIWHFYIKKTKIYENERQIIVLPMMNLGDGHIEILDVPARHINPIIVRALVQAAREQLRIDVDYVSLIRERKVGVILSLTH